MKKNKNYLPIIIIAVMLAAILFTDVLLVFGMTTSQTAETGQYQLESISGELESTINEAKNLTLQLALEAQALLDDKDALREFIYDRKARLSDYLNGGYNIYIAGDGWDIIPDLVNREGYVATQRGWYTGAARNGGSAYVTPPYSDAATGNICYTVSVMLADGVTVLGIDYTMENIQAHVVKLNETGLHNAVVVTEDGIIAGGSDETLIGKLLTDSLPDYSAVFHLAKNSDGFVNHRIRSGMLYENLFAARSASGWYLIVSESDWDLYHNSYILLIITTLLMLSLIAVIIVLYVITAKNRRKAEDALRSKDEFLAGITTELEAPLRKIIAGSDIKNYPDIAGAESRLDAIHEAGENLSHTIRQIISYSSIVRTEEKKKDTVQKTGRFLRMNKRFRNLILSLLILVMAVSLSAVGILSVGLAGAKMENDVSRYEHDLSEWIYQQKSILDMFSSIISTNPALLEYYDVTIKYLDDIAKQYPEISVVYMSNPELEPQVYMNNGWKPEEGWHVDERPWYIETLAAKDGWSISTPYFDDQTGIYCVTFSEQVYDSATGEFLGIFGIDFYMDKLIGILDDSYSESGYAFLADASGDIINHPYGTYQMSVENTTNVSALSYGELDPDNQGTMMIRDYDGISRIVTAKRSELSKFTVYKATGVWYIYGQSLLVALICFAALTVSIVIVYRLLSRLISWQDSVNSRMKEAADEATAAGKAKSRFLAQMSHEIRTPINAVLGMNEMILRESKDENILDYSENIQTAGKTLLSLINSILDFSKIEDGKMEIIPVKYDTVSVINNLVHSVSERAKEKGLELIVRADPQLPARMTGDDVRVSQVISNLLTNAVKYTEHGSVTFTIEGKERTDTDIVLAVTVKDTGIGIREEDMSKLFESFSRLDETRNRNIEGTGLGMAIVTKLLSLMDSELSVESVYGAGSTFSFEIKQGISDPKPIGEQLERRADPTNRKKEKKHFFGARILVTDDNEMNLKVAQNLLKLFGIKPDLASSGEETIELMRSKRYDIVFLDHMMPKMDGIETLNALKEQGLIPAATTVIALTANAVIGAKETYIKAGFDDYLSKPIELDRLEEKLIQHLPAKLTGRAPKPEPEPAQQPDQPSANPDSAFSEQLEAAGFSVSSGLSYCAGDMSFYKEILTDFAYSGNDRIADMESALAADDTDSYRVFVHALKSASRTVGADDIAELAQTLEECAKNNDTAAIDQRHGELKAMLRSKTAALKKILEPGR